MDTQSRQLLIYDLISYLVLLNLSAPEIGSCVRRFSVAYWTAVPKTTINKYCDLFLRKPEVWPPDHCFCIAFPSPNLRPYKPGCHSDFG